MDMMHGPTAAEALGGRPADDHWVAAIVRELSSGADVPPPPVFVMASEVPNAFATGDSQDRAAVTFTTRLLAELEPDELRAVAAHEVGHIVLGHVGARSEIAAHLAAGATVASVAAIELGQAAGAMTEDTDDDALFGLLGVALAGVAHAGARSRLHESTRRQELEADDVAAVLGGSHGALARALDRLERLPVAAEDAPAWMNYLGFHEGETPDATHPTTENRSASVARWARTETASSWWCSRCYAGNRRAAQFCRRCGLGRTTPTIAPSARCQCTPGHEIDASHCERCGGPISSRGLDELVRLRTPSAFGLRRTRTRAPARQELDTGFAPTPDDGLSRTQRFSMSAHLRRVDREASGWSSPPLAISGVRVRTLEYDVDGTLAVTGHGLELLTDHESESIGWGDVGHLSVPTDDDTPVSIVVDDASITLDVSGPTKARVKSLLRTLMHRRAGRTASVAW